MCCAGIGCAIDSEANWDDRPSRKEARRPV
jgi:hypothetical protein